MAKPKLEVWITDPFTQTRVVAEYRGELRRKVDGFAVYKVYSPYFDITPIPTIDTQLQAYRWVNRIDVLGSSPKDEDVVRHLEVQVTPKTVDFWDRGATWAKA